MKCRALFMAAMVPAVVAGCDAFTSPVRVRALDTTKPQIVEYKARYRGQIVLSGVGQTLSCSEPQPDVAYSSVSKATGLQKDPSGVTLNVGGEFDETAQVVNQNTQLVLFMRETLFRLCEMSMNEKLTQEQVFNIYKDILDTSRTMFQAAKAASNAQENKASAENNKSLLELQRFQIKSNIPITKEPKDNR